MKLTKRQQSMLPRGCSVRDDGPPKKESNKRYKVCEPFIMGSIVHGGGNTIDEAIVNARAALKLPAI